LQSEVQKFAKTRKTGIVDPKTTVYTDEWAGYRNVHSTHPTHHAIHHTDRVYAREAHS
jgi:ISXO2-like transposase domain